MKHLWDRADHLRRELRKIEMEIRCREFYNAKYEAAKKAWKEKCERKEVK